MCRAVQSENSADRCARAGGSRFGSSEPPPPKHQTPAAAGVHIDEPFCLDPGDYASAKKRWPGRPGSSNNFPPTTPLSLRHRLVYFHIK